MRRIPLALLALVLAASVWMPAAEPATSEELPPLDGVVVKRGDGTLLQVKIEGVRVVLRFFDEKHAPIKPDVDGAWIRAVSSVRRPERRVLAPSDDGMSLTHGIPLRPPHVFKLYITLTRGGEESGVESHTVDYP